MNRTITTSLASLGAIMAITPGLIATASAAATSTTSSDQQHLSTIQTKGNQEIDRRLTSLGALNAKISAATKLTATDKSSLTSEVNSEISGLTGLKAKLDADTTVAAAKTDAQSIINDYRVYALVTPKIWLIKTADDQQVAETKLQALATKLQTRITDMQSKGKDVTALQAALSDMNSQLQTSIGISSKIESAVIGLQPSDYDSNHTVLSGDSAQLKTAHAADAKALSDAKTIIAGVKGQA